MHRIYVATPDGAFDGRAPLAQIPSRADPASLPWTQGRANAYTEALSATTTEESYVDVDLVRVSGSYMGPPIGCGG